MTCIYCSVAMSYAHVQYPKSVSFIEFLMDFCIYGDIADTYIIQITAADKSHYIQNSQNKVKFTCR